MADGKKALDQVLALLDLELIEEDIFRGQSPEGRVQRVFGGQVLGQALVAAARTVEPHAGESREHGHGLCLNCEEAATGYEGDEEHEYYWDQWAEG